MRGLLKKSVEFERLVEVYNEGHEAKAKGCTNNFAAFVAGYMSQRGTVVEDTENWVWPDDFYEELGLWADCPYCGSDYGWTDHNKTGDYYQFVCDDCGMKGPRGNSVEDAKNNWNILADKLSL